MPKPLDGRGTSSLNVSQRKKRFLAAYAHCGNVSDAADQAQIERRTVYDWQEHDENFTLAMRTAGEEASERIEAEIYRRGVVGVEKPVFQGGKLVGLVREYSDTLLIFLAKALRPEKYRERYDVTTAGEPLVKAYGLTQDQLDQV